MSFRTLEAGPQFDLWQSILNRRIPRKPFKWLENHHVYLPNFRGIFATTPGKYPSKEEKNRHIPKQKGTNEEKKVN